MKRKEDNIKWWAEQVRFGDLLPNVGFYLENPIEKDALPKHAGYYPMDDDALVWTLCPGWCYPHNPYLKPVQREQTPKPADPNVPLCEAVRNLINSRSSDWF